MDPDDPQEPQDSENSEDEPQPLHLRPSDEPWKPVHGRKTHVVAWVILIGMFVAIAVMLFAIFAGP